MRAPRDFRLPLVDLTFSPKNKQSLILSTEPPVEKPVEKKGLASVILGRASVCLAAGCCWP